MVQRHYVIPFVAAAYNERGILKRDKAMIGILLVKLQRYNVRSNVDFEIESYYAITF